MRFRLEPDRLVCCACGWERPLAPDEGLDDAREDCRLHWTVYHSAHARTELRLSA